MFTTRYGPGLWKTNYVSFLRHYYYYYYYYTIFVTIIRRLESGVVSSGQTCAGTGIISSRGEKMVENDCSTYVVTGVLGILRTLPNLVWPCLGGGCIDNIINLNVRGPRTRSPEELVIPHNSS